MVHLTERRLAGVVSALLMTILVLGTADIVDDYHSGVSTLHLLTEAIVMIAAAGGYLMLVARLLLVGRTAAEMSATFETTQRDAERWRREASTHIERLASAMDVQFDRWGLTSAEREVTLLLLEGCGLRDVAERRGVKDRTIRAQAQAVYNKAGVAGRAELSAFFLQDLLPSRSRARSEATRRTLGLARLEPVEEGAAASDVGSAAISS